MRLTIFVKAPRLGTVKTRLARDVGDSAALEIYQQLVQRLIENVGTIPNVELRFTPDDARAEITDWLRNSWTAVAQGAGDLGDRMSRAFGESFKQGISKAVIIGSDCPTVSENDIQRAFEALEKHDLVLGPSTDGGYWLIGLRRGCPELFANMMWSHAEVLKETLRRAEKLGLSYRLLSEKTDIDDLESWENYQTSMADKKTS